MPLLQLVSVRIGLPKQPDPKTPTRHRRQQMPLVRIDLDAERVLAFAFGECMSGD